MTPNDLKALIGQDTDPYHVALLRHAEVFAGRRAVKTLPAAVAWRKEKRPQPKECYCNAQSFAAFGGASAVYYEGYWGKSGRAVHHAWVVVGGEVIDFTAEAGERLKRKLGVTSTASAECYCGMPVPTRFIIGQVGRTGCWLPATAAYLNTLGFPVQRPECPTLLPLTATATADAD